MCYYLECLWLLFGDNYPLYISKCQTCFYFALPIMVHNYSHPSQIHSKLTGSSTCLAVYLGIENCAQKTPPLLDSMVQNGKITKHYAKLCGKSLLNNCCPNNILSHQGIIVKEKHIYIITCLFKYYIIDEVLVSELLTWFACPTCYQESYYKWRSLSNRVNVFYLLH